MAEKCGNGGGYEGAETGGKFTKSKAKAKMSFLFKIIF